MVERGGGGEVECLVAACEHERRRRSSADRVQIECRSSAGARWRRRWRQAERLIVSECEHLDESEACGVVEAESGARHMDELEVE